MSKKTFTAGEVKQLSANPYVRSVSTKGITYTDEFKQLFITSNQQGKLPRDIFEACGFDVQIIGITRI
ncbi:HTH domain-containing protein, partial [Paenibacillus terrae]